MKENKSAKNLVPVENNSQMAYYLDTHKFEHAMRVANMLAKANMVPVAYRNSPADCLIAFNSAVRMGLDPLQFMQKTYVVHGKIGIESQLAIALMNKSKLFTDVIQYKYSGEGAARECRAFAFTFATGAECYEICSVQQAKDMGWWAKKDSPWPKQTDKMLAYRSAINLIRKYHPEVLFGMDIAEDLKDFSPKNITGEINQATNSSTPPPEPPSDKKMPEAQEEVPEKKAETPLEETKEQGEASYVEQLQIMMGDPGYVDVLAHCCGMPHIPVTEEAIKEAIKDKDESRAKGLIQTIKSQSR